MKKLICAAAVLLVTVAPAAAWFHTHKDGGGYTYKEPGHTYSYRYGSGATYQKWGNSSTYRSNNGTSGYSYYAPSYRYDNYSNPYKGWRGSGTSYYKGGTTYRRYR